MQASIIGAVVTLLAGAVSGTITYGVYGSLAIKPGARKMNPWAAGAITGVLTGLIGAALVFVTGLIAGGTRGLGMVTAQRLRGLTINQLPATTGILTAQKLTGVYLQPMR